MSRKLGNRKLPKGIYIDGDYVKVRIFHNYQPVIRHIGPLSENGIIDKAVSVLNTLRDDIRADKTVTTKKEIRWTVAQACDYYWDKEGSKMKSADSIHIFIVRTKEILGNKFLDECTFQDAKDYRTTLKSMGLTELNINRHHTYLTRLFNIIKIWRRTKTIGNVKLPDENPGTLVNRTKETWRKRVLTVEEFDRLIAAASPKLRRILIMAVHTLLRCKDLDSLTISKNVNWSMNQLHGIQAKVDGHSESAEYELPINEQVMNIITSTPEGEDKILDFSNFAKEFGRGPRSAQTLSGVTGLMMTDIRRTGARWMLKSGIDIATVSKYLGHTSIEMTQRYVGADTTDLRRGAVILDGLFKMPASLDVPMAVNQ